MDKSALEKALAFPGLDEHESQVYLTTFELKRPTPLRIAEHIGMPRPTVYRILESLVKKGLMGVVVEGKRRVFVPEKPSVIIHRLKLQASAIQNLLPDFEALYAIYRGRPKIRLFDGREGMKRVCDDILITNAKELLSFSSVTNLFAFLPDYFPAFVKKRIQKKIRARVLALPSPKAMERKRLGAKELREVRFLPQGFPFVFDGLTFIYGDRVAFMSFRGDQNAVIIEHPELANVQRALFEAAWMKAGGG